MPLLDPLGATTRGLGEVIAAALDAGATAVVVALGGSASTDGGAGALAALGARFLDRDGAELADGGGALVDLATVDTSALRPPPPGGVRLLTDVNSPLLGMDGAAAVFAPQKGAAPGDVELLDAALARFAAVVGGHPETPGAGAAGGTAFGLATLWGARIEPGAPAVAAVTRLDSALEGADVLLTGEGRFDDQSRRGKVVGHALDLAAALKIRTGVIAGRLDLAPPDWGADLTVLAGSAEAAMADPIRWLHEAGRRAAAELGAAAASAPPHPAPLD
jgi:glycerate kinase